MWRCVQTGYIQGFLWRGPLCAFLKFSQHFSNLTMKRNFSSDTLLHVGNWDSWLYYHQNKNGELKYLLIKDMHKKWLDILKRKTWRMGLFLTVFDHFIISQDCFGIHFSTHPLFLVLLLHIAPNVFIVFECLDIIIHI